MTTIKAIGLLPDQHGQVLKVVGNIVFIETVVLLNLVSIY